MATIKFREHGKLIHEYYFYCQPRHLTFKESRFSSKKWTTKQSIQSYAHQNQVAKPLPGYHHPLEQLLTISWSIFSLMYIVTLFCVPHSCFWPNNFLIYCSCCGLMFCSLKILYLPLYLEFMFVNFLRLLSPNIDW